MNLRKMRKLENKISKFLTKLSFGHSVEVRIKGTVDDANKRVNEGREQVAGTFAAYLDLVELRFDIRRQIDNANQTHEISALMNRREMLKGKLTILQQTDSFQVTPDETKLTDILTTKARALDKGVNSSYFGDEVTVKVPVMSSTMKHSYIATAAAIVKELEEIEDKLAQKNLSSKLELNSSQVKLLESVGLL